MALGRGVELIPATLDALQPAQTTVGFREVKAKRKHWQSLGKQARREPLEQHGFPAVLGPGQALYLVRKQFRKALEAALARAHGPEARYLPGWSGVFEAGQ